MMVRVCDRCGEKLLRSDLKVRIFKVTYKTLSTEGPEYRSMDLCEECQKDLRRDFYARGILYGTGGESYRTE